MGLPSRNSNSSTGATSASGNVNTSLDLERFDFDDVLRSHLKQGSLSGAPTDASRKTDFLVIILVLSTRREMKIKMTFNTSF